MAESFFGFDTALNRDEECSGALEDLEDEQEYDALNDETFGGSADDSTAGPFDDWESQHEQLAEIAEHSKQSQKLETSLSQLVEDEDLLSTPDSLSSTIWSVSKPQSISSPHLKSKTIKPIGTRNIPDVNNASSAFDTHTHKIAGASNGISLPKNVCTVEELERGLLTNRQPNTPDHNKQFLPNFSVPPGLQAPRYPPGLGPVLIPPAYHPNRLGPQPQPPPGLLRYLPPHPMLMQHGVPPTHNMPPGPGGPPRSGPPPMHPNMGMHHKNNMIHPRMNYPAQPGFNNFRPDFTHQTPSFQPYSHIRPPYQVDNSHMFMKNMGGPNNRNMSHNVVPLPCPVENHDEYAGLMTNREKQWLINIQLLQLNTGTPYFDDFYYTVFIDRQNKIGKENRPAMSQDRQSFPGHRTFHNQNNRYNNTNRKDNYYKDNHHDRDRTHGNRCNERDNNQTQVHRIYTPLQFENSLGKLQCGSVTAPRKIIDMDVVPHEKEFESNQSSVNNQRDVRRTKQTLLELEILFALVLRLEDLNNPLAIANTLKLREIKEKQKIQQLETATTEEKVEILRQLQEDSLVKSDVKEDLLAKILAGLLCEDKFTSYIGIRKGKVLLLRFFPHLNKDIYYEKLVEIWINLLAAIPIIGKRDQISDNTLPQFFHFFDRFADHAHMDTILTIANTLVDVKNSDNCRHTPRGKSSLNFILNNKLGVSCVTRLLERCSTLQATTVITDKQKREWSEFLSCLLETLNLSGVAEVPMQPMEFNCLENLLRRTPSISTDNYAMFSNIFCNKHNS